MKARWLVVWLLIQPLRRSLMSHCSTQRKIHGSEWQLDICRRDCYKLGKVSKLLNHFMPAIDFKAYLWQSDTFQEKRWDYGGQTCTPYRSFTVMLVWVSDQLQSKYMCFLARELWYSCLFSHTAQRASTQMFSKCQCGPMVLWLFSVLRLLSCLDMNLLWVLIFTLFSWITSAACLRNDKDTIQYFLTYLKMQTLSWSSFTTKKNIR